MRLIIETRLPCSYEIDSRLVYDKIESIEYHKSQEQNMVSFTFRNEEGKIEMGEILLYGHNRVMLME